MARGRYIDPHTWKPGGDIELEKTAREVVMSPKNMSVIAGPGSGKTELLAQRALFLLQTGGCPAPQRILAISFKRDAAKNLKDRVAERCTPDMAQRFDSQTFDAFGKSLVDRFRALAPGGVKPPRNYGIYFTSRNDWPHFVQGLKPPAELGGMPAAQALGLDEVESAELAPSGDAIQTMTEWLAYRWWAERLTASEPGLTFAMINTLAYLLLQQNKQLRRALQLTYSHVFLDEFQDTTPEQYRLVRLAFHGSLAVLTAVGDTKQRIMTWAGADPVIFQTFQEDFQAERVRLQMNFRSNARVVQIINDLVDEIEENAVETVSARANQEVPDDAAAFVIFDTDEEEERWLASFVAESVANAGPKGPNPEDIALLVRQKADHTEDRLTQPFEAMGLRIRNEARRVGALAIQDVMTDDLCLMVIGLLRLAFRVRAHEIYSDVQELLGATLAIDYTNPGDVRKLDERIRDIIAAIRVHAAETQPQQTNFDKFVGEILQKIGIEAIQSTYRQYEDSAFLGQVAQSLIQLMAENAPSAGSWQDLVEAVEGRGQVRLMTIHKSKGLEYHTVIFVGLHQEQFWGYRNDPDEETNAFFVALSRARERIYFTRSAEGGGLQRIAGLIKLLEKAGVPLLEPYADGAG